MDGASHVQAAGDLPAVTTGTTDSLDDDELDETWTERLLGLGEMFPESVQNSCHKLATASASGVKSLYKFSRSMFWVVFSSAAILVAPVAIELERSSIEEMSKQQQRQILLGPSAAMSSGSGSLPGMLPMPVQPAPAPR